MPETDGGLRSLYRKHIFVGCHWQSIESALTGSGIPDCDVQFQGEGLQTWIENKQTDGWTCTLRAAQVGWIMRRWMLGGRVLVATRRRNNRGDDELWLHKGQYATELQLRGLRSSPPALVERGGPSQWDWSRVEAVMRDPRSPTWEADARGLGL